ncbi:MAG TPA: hypothetical protein VMT92_04815 [Steroidobacteraceae bacterium]|nr:hypothetical protein [Steroidobacteraceae bacterium]
MSAFNRETFSCASALLLLIGSTAQAATLYVNCGGKGPLASITAALKVLRSSESNGPNTINVAGACRENVQIRNVQQLTLNAINGASITDTTNGVVETIGIYYSTGVTVSGFTVNGGGTSNGLSDAISIGQAMAVLNGITAQFAASAGVGVYRGATVFINGATLQYNGYAGLGVFGGDANAAGVTSQQNWAGVVVDHAGRAQYRPTDPAYEGGSASVRAIITGNTNVGVLVQNHGEINCPSCEITNNSAGGVSLDLGAAATFSRMYLVSGPPVAPLTITSNGGAGVSVGDLSSATFPYSQQNGLISGNNAAQQIVCTGTGSVTRRAIQFDAGTKCPN